MPSKVPIVMPNVKPCFEKRLETFDDIISSSSGSVSVSMTIILGESIDISVKSIIGCDGMLLLIALIFGKGVRRRNFARFGRSFVVVLLHGVGGVCRMRALEVGELSA